MTTKAATRIGIDASAMLIRRKNGYENYVSALLPQIAELPRSDTEGLELFLYFHAGNPLADPALLNSLLPKLKGFRCRVYRPGRLFGAVLPLMALIDRLDWLHLPVYSWSCRYPCRVGITLHDACGARLARRADGRAEVVLQGLDIDLARSISRASAFIAVSEYTRKDVVEFYDVRPERIQVVHHGTDPFFYPSPDDVRQVQAKYHLGRYILDVNALQVNKNHGRLLEAFAGLRQRYSIPHKLVLVGRDGLGAMEIRALIGRYNADGRVVHLDYVSREDLRGLYSGAELVVNPSLCEGFGLPMLEAMACGAIVAASNATSLPEVGGEAAIYFDPRDVESMAMAIWSGLSNTALRRELQDKAARRTREFSWRQAARDTLAAYRTWRHLS